MSQNLKKSYRDKFLASRKAENYEFECDGMELYYKRPTVRENIKMLTAEKEHNLLWIAVQSTYVKGTNERLFSDDDYELLLELPSGDVLVDKLVEQVMKGFTGVESDPKDSSES